MAATNHTLTFVNGVAVATLPVGTYTYVSSSVAGYKDATIESFTVTPQTTSLALTITANGNLTINVMDDLDTPITAGSLQFSNNDGTVKYGSAVEITDGTATFANVPYDENGIALFLSQEGSDESHVPIDTPQAISMTTSPQTENVLNERKPITFNMNLSDAIYEGITALNGDLVVNG